MDKTSPSSVPLLQADTGVIVESPTAGRVNTQQDLEGGVWFSTFLGVAIGFSAPYLAIGLTLLVAIGVSTWFGVVLPVPAIMIQLVFVMLFCTLSVYQGILLGWFRGQSLAEDTLELMKLRFVLGALVGLLISWVLTCVVLGFTFWDKVGLVSGLITVVWSYETPAANLNEDDYQTQPAKSVSITVV